MPDRRVLVVGTTPDYIAYIDRNYPGRALFLTEPGQRTGAREPSPSELDEIVIDLSSVRPVLAALEDHLRKHGLRLSGIACYDCERLGLAAQLADKLGLEYPTLQSVRTARDKYLTKRAWTAGGVRCPRANSVNSPDNAVQLMRDWHRPVVLKPATGSGSELTFLCENESEVIGAFRLVRDGLIERRDHPMFGGDRLARSSDRFVPNVLVEEYIGGVEYSADFILDGRDVRIVRVAQKLFDPNQPFGVALGYVVPAVLPEPLNERELGLALGRAADVLELDRAICMADFRVFNGEIVLLELTPRIGGDCLPPLIRQASGLDTIELALRFAGRLLFELPEPEDWKRTVGVRLLAQSSGLLRAVNFRQLTGDRRILETYLKRTPGYHEVVLPPEDYDSLVLGHVIFTPATDENLLEQCHEVANRVEINVERCKGHGPAQADLEDHRAVRSANPSA